MMSSNVFWNLEKAQQCLTQVESDLNNAPEIADIVELLDAVEAVDNYYRDNFCLECDANWGEEPGNTYEDGTSMEFYIEADWWHDISLALRKLRDRKPNEDE